MDIFDAPLLSRDEQLAALTPQVIKDYAEGRLSWSQIRRQLDVCCATIKVRVRDNQGENGFSGLS